MTATKSLSRETIQAAPPPDASAAPPAYFLSLTIENFRCFGPAQTLELSQGENRPAPWTIILGENGVGKTTLLQCLAVFQTDLENGISFNTNLLYLMGAYGHLRTRQRTAESVFTLTCRLGESLTLSGVGSSVGFLSVVTRLESGSFGGHALDTRSLIWVFIYLANPSN